MCVFILNLLPVRLIRKVELGCVFVCVTDAVQVIFLTDPELCSENTQGVPLVFSVDGYG